MLIKFNDSQDFTLGIELELQLVDRDEYSLVQTSSGVIDNLAVHRDSVKHELMMSNIEVISAVCPDIRAAEADLKQKVAAVMDAGAALNSTLSSASTHPFSSWRDQSITEDPRYLRLLENLQVIARRFNIFGLHVHVGVRGGERCIYIMNRILYYLPHLLALSSNSPFWQGEDTGLRSYRTKVFEMLPIAGLPFYFHDWADYARLVENYLKTGTIETIRELWWDIRPHPDFGTIEVRVCDIPSTIEEVLAIASLIQAMVRRFSMDFDRSMPFTRPHSATIRENKWRACRYGIDGSFINEDGGTTTPTKEALAALADSVRGDAEELGSGEYFEKVYGILENGTGASRQLEAYRKTGSLKEVVRSISSNLEREVRGSEGGGA